MEAVGIVLAAVALLDPVYRGLQSLWKAYKTVEYFGDDFEISLSGLRCQEWIFASHLQLYETQCRLNGPGSAHASNHPLKEQIAAHITAIVNVLNQCYGVVETYDNECNPTVARNNQPAAAQSQNVPQAAAYIARQPRRLVKLPQRARIEEGFVAWLNRNSEILRAKESHETTEKQRLKAPRPIQVTGDSLAFAPRLQRGLGGSSDEATLSAHRERILKRTQAAQKRANGLQLVRWADHGKEDFDGFVSRLRNMNDDLRRILPIEAQLDDAFRKIRASSEPPKLWDNTEKIRHELDGLHIAIRSINVPSEGFEPIRFAVKLEENFEELRARAEEYGIITDLPLTRQPYLFSLMPRPQGISNNQKDYILSTTVYKTSEPEIANLPASMARLGANDPENNTIGNVIHSIENRWIYHLQRVEDEDLVGGHSVSRLIKDEKLREKERICLAADIAQSFVHFMTINMGKPRGLSSNYHLFGQASPDPATGNWTPELLSSLWVEFGFGISLASKSSKFRSKAQYREGRIRAPLELGILIYQIASGVVLDYTATADSLEKARDDTKSGLKAVEEFCGLYMREIVEVCLKDPGNGIEEKDIVAEVASALSYHAAQLRKVKG
ncbi:hypothetical protein FZEAL_8950 [Fusarium zealandicum]|uniref:Prion-inhibition and propagation HeLo domain-containing protein n=1 Tax=Fusarium zealandicum TaxID=1053134 RepID=A0A8H4XGD1_9HYPO|nr:hypothetical protein FZEAL_8950 [Fusarium zealandicum]